MDAGGKLLKELTVAPLKAGLEEYETQINSVQTILSNTSDALIERGFTTEHDRIEKVNSVLDELNKYADMTIYNFTEMTRNIGTFTAAGVELDTAATSIKGIANLAAMSGSNSQQASTAMYQLSQAIAAGSVKLQDWNSVVNAGMGGKLFQNELIDTAKAMGVADEQFIALTQGATTFRESLSSGWISAEVLTNTLEKFTAGSEGYTKSQVAQMRQLWEARGYSKTMIDELTGSIKVLDEEQEKNLRTKWAEKGFSDEQIDHILSMGTAATDAATKVKTFSQLIETVQEALQSGWTQSWEYIIGDFEQAKRLWTEISDILNLYIGKSADSRNKILEEWSRAAYSYNEAGELIYAADGRVVEGGKMVAEEMGGREAVIQSLRNTFQGLLEIGVQFRKAWDWYFWGKDTKGNNNALEDLSMSGEKLIAMSKKLLKFTEDFKNSLKVDDKGNAIGFLKELRTAFEFFATSARKAFLGIKDVFSGLGNVFKGFFKSDIFSMDTLNLFLTMFSGIAARISEIGTSIKKNFAGASNLEGLTKFFTGLGDVFKEGIWLKFEAFNSAFGALGSIIEHLIAPFGTFSNLLGIIGTKLSTLMDAINKMFHNEDVSKFETLFDGIADSFNKFIDVIRQSVDFSGFSETFNNLVSALSSEAINPFQILSNVIEGLVNIFKALLSVITPVAAAFANVFGSAIKEAVIFIRDVSDRFKSFTESLIANGQVMSAIQHAFEGLFNVVKAIGEVIGTVFLSAWDALARIFSSILPSSENLSTTLNNLGDMLNNLASNISSLVTGSDGVPKLSELLGTMTDKVVKLFGAFKSDLNLLEKFGKLIKSIGDGLKHALGGTEDMSLLDTIFDKIKGFMDRLRKLFSDDHGNLDFVKIFEAGGIAAVMKKLIDFFTNLKSSTSNFTGFLSIISDIKDAFEDLSDSLGEKFKAESIKSISTAILELAGALFIIAMIDPVALGQAILTVKAMMVMIEDLLMAVKSLNKEDAVVLGAAAAAIQTLGNAILMMAGAAVLLGSMDFLNAVQGIGAIGILMQGLVLAVKELSKVEGQIPKIAAAVISLAIAINLLIVPVKIFGSMDVASLAKGLVAVAASMVLLVSALESIDRSIDGGGATLIASGAAMIMMATAMTILASAVRKISDISWEGIAKGLVVFAAGLGALVAAAAIIGSNKLSDDIIATAGSLLMLGAAMMMMSAAVNGLAGASWESIGKAGVVLAGALVALGVASKLISGPNLLMIAGAIALVATAFLELEAALNIGKIIGPICTSIGAGLTSVSDSLVAFAHHASAQAFIQFLKDAILFLPQLAVALAQSAVDMVATIGAAAAQLVTAVTQIGSAILTGVITLLPQIFETIRVFIEGVVNLIITEAPLIFSALTVLMEQVWTFLTEQVPLFFEFLTTVFTELFTFLQTEGPLLVETIRLMLDTILQAIIEETPMIGEAFLTVLHTVLDTINTAVPEIIETLLYLISDLLAKLAEFAPQMAENALQIILAFLNTVAAHIGEITESAISIAIGFMDGIAQKMGDIVDSALKLIIAFINGLADAIDANHGALFAAVGNLIRSIVEAIGEGIRDVVDKGKEMVGDFIDGLTSGDFIGRMAQAGIDLVNGFIDGIGSMVDNAIGAAANLAGQTWGAVCSALGINSPSKVAHEGGIWFIQGFVNGIDEMTSDTKKSATNIAATAMDALIQGMDDDLTPTITPVLDMSDIRSGAKEINGIFDSAQSTIGISANLSSQSSIMQDVISALESNSKSDYSSILIGMNDLRKDLAAYTNQLANLQVVMDSGTLVGAITPQMDSALGIRRMMAGRGVI